MKHQSRLISTALADDLDDAEKLEPQKQGEGKEEGQHE